MYKLYEKKTHSNTCFHGVIFLLFRVKYLPFKKGKFGFSVTVYPHKRGVFFSDKCVFRPMHVILVCSKVVAQFVEALRYNSDVAGSIPDVVTGIFH
jgi:hypothetical protein